MDAFGLDEASLETDAELLAELAALQKEEDEKQRKAAAASRPSPLPPVVPPKRSVPAPPTEAETEGAFENDPDLLRELEAIAGEEGVSVDQLLSRQASQSATVAGERDEKSSSSRSSSQQPAVDLDRLKEIGALLEAYRDAHKSASQSGDAARARRYERTADRLGELRERCSRGDPTASTEELPPLPPKKPAAAPAAPPSVPPSPPAAKPPPLPPRATSAAPEPPSPKAKPPPSSDSASEESRLRSDIMTLLKRRKDANVRYAKEAMSVGDKSTAAEYIQTAKQFDAAMEIVPTAPLDALNPNEIPPSPQPYRKPSSSSAASAPEPAPQNQQKNTTPQPNTFKEALEWRRARFQELADRNASDPRRSRMYVRSVASYDDALKELARNRPIDASELPKLPDFPALPAQQPTAAAAAPAGPSRQAKPPPSVGPLAPPPAGVAQPGASRNSVQLDFLLERQRLFREAALMAKKRGHIDAAKGYLAAARGFDPMVEAARRGHPVDVSKAPVPPQMHTSASALRPQIAAGRREHNAEMVDGDRATTLAKMERRLCEQVATAEAGAIAFGKHSDVGRVRLLESWAAASRNDLIIVRRVASDPGLRVPPCHYENRDVPHFELNAGIAEDALQLWIGAAREVPLPSGYEEKHAAIYVRFTLPWPTESPQSGKTKIVNETSSPVFDETFSLSINRRARPLYRVIKRGVVKLELYQKVGFMRSDKLLGTAELRLEPLEESAQSEATCPLMDGKKAAGGVLSARVRVREPLSGGGAGGSSQQHKAPTRSEKWLVLDI